MNGNTIDVNVIYAALKLIQNLFKNGVLKEYIYKNILKDYAKYIDISDFV